MFCVNCGNRLPDNSRFCNMCGTDLSTRIAPPAQRAATSGGYSQPQQGGNQQAMRYQQGAGSAGPQGYQNTGFGQSGGFPQQGAGQPGGFPQQGFGQPGGFSQQGAGQQGGFSQPGFSQQGGYQQGDGQLGFGQNTAFPQQQGYPQQGFERSMPPVPPVGYAPPVEQGQPKEFTPVNPDEVIMDAGKVSFYNSEKAMVVGGSGKLRIFSDRLEYHILTGSQAGFAFGPLIGGAMMMKKKGKVDEFYFDRIKDVRIAKHMGMMNKVVLEFTDGKTCAFMPMEKGSKTNAHAQKIHDTIKGLIR